MPEGPAFYVYEDRSNDWRWSLVASNYEIIGDSGEGYSSHSGATAAVGRIQQLLRSAALHIHDKELPPGR